MSFYKLSLFFVLNIILGMSFIYRFLIFQESEYLAFLGQQIERTQATEQDDVRNIKRVYTFFPSIVKLKSFCSSIFLI